MLPEDTSSAKPGFVSLQNENCDDELHQYVNNPLHVFGSNYFVPIESQEDHNRSMFVSQMDDNVATCITLEEDGSSKDSNSSGVVNKSYAQFVKIAEADGWREPSTASKVTSVENPHQRNFIYVRHHHQPLDSLNCVSPPSDSQSTPGLLYNFRGSKMSVSSSSSSPRAGSFSGSYSRSPVIHQHQFTRINSTISGSNPVMAVCYSPLKKYSAMSTSPSISSYRSSTSSSTGASSRKRHADGDLQRCSGYSSTSEVAVGVGNVNINDRLSIGSVSPTELIVEQPHKKSKGSHDNHDDDDVIFVSHEPSPIVKPSPQSVNKSLPPTFNHSVKSSKGHKNKGRDTIIYRSSKNSIPSQKPCDKVKDRSTTETRQLVKQSDMDNSSLLFASVTQSSPSESNSYFLRSSVNTVATKACDSHVQQPLKTVMKPCVEQDEKQSQQKSKYATRSQRLKQAIVDVDNPSGEKLSRIEPKKEELSQHAAPRSSASKPMLSDHRFTPSFRAKYEIKEQIGVGGGGVVFSGTRKSDLAEVAIKRVPKDKVRRWGKLDGRRVPLEFELLQRAEKGGNSGVIRMYDWFERTKSYVLVMEKPKPVIDLFDYLSQYGPMKEALAKKIFRQIVEAVNKFHTNGVVHRDIKDENVLLNLQTEEAKVIDFGCGTYLQENAYTEFAGTPEFYPPEWFKDRRYFGKRVDAWSIGVLLYTMLESEVPFPKEQDTVNCKWKFNRTEGVISSSCRYLIESMLQKDQEKRPSLSDVLKHPWLQENVSQTSSSERKILRKSGVKSCSFSKPSTASLVNCQIKISSPSTSITSSKSSNSSNQSHVSSRSPPPYSLQKSSLRSPPSYSIPNKSQSSRTATSSSSQSKPTLDYSLYNPRPISENFSHPPPKYSSLYYHGPAYFSTQSKSGDYSVATSQCPSKALESKPNAAFSVPIVAEKHPTDPLHGPQLHITPIFPHPTLSPLQNHYIATTAYSPGSPPPNYFYLNGGLPHITSSPNWPYPTALK